MKIFYYAAAVLLLVILKTDCNSRKHTADEIILKEVKSIASKWEDYFESSHPIQFIFDNQDMEVISIGDLVISSRGDYFILDGKVKKILWFSAAGNFLQFISRYGEGPGEYLLPGCLALDEKDNLYFFDLVKQTIIKHASPEYKFDKQIRINQFIQDLMIDGNGDYIGYSLSSAKRKILFKFNDSGKSIDMNFSPQHERLLIFLARFGLGRFSPIDNRSFLFFYPEEYKIYLYGCDFKIKKVLIPGSSSMYYPFMEELPGYLSPFDFNKEQAKWWRKSLRTASIFYLGDGIFITILFDYKDRDIVSYINIHSIDGMTYARGLKVPFNGIIRCAKDGYVYVVEDSVFDEKGNILPLRLHRFKLRNLKQHPLD